MTWPNFHTHDDGRISFTGVVEYHVKGRFGTEVLPYPPTAESHPGPSESVPLVSENTARLIAEGKIKPIPRSLPYFRMVLDGDECRRLASAGWLTDPRHTGRPDTPAIDNRRTA